MPTRQSLIQQIDDIQRQLDALRLSIANEQPPQHTNQQNRANEERQLEVGDLVRILNPNPLLRQASTGRVVRINNDTGYVFVRETTGLRRTIRRKLHNLSRINSTISLSSTAINPSTAQ